MPDLDFKIIGVEAGARGIAPLLNFQLEIANKPGAEEVQSILLRSQIQIDAPQRRYSEQEKEQLVELFGPAADWGRTLRNRLWTNAQATVGPFVGVIETQLSIPCTYDLNIASARYFHALEEGEIPLVFLFSGTVFYVGDHRILQAAQIPWTKECRYLMPLATWRGMMEQHFPGRAWICLPRDAVDRLHAYRRHHGLLSCDEAIDRLLPVTKNQEAAV